LALGCRPPPRALRLCLRACHSHQLAVA
jgi:hypothetical protein